MLSPKRQVSTFAQTAFGRVIMTGVAKGEMLRAKGRVLQDGRTNSIGAADVYSVSDGTERLCGTVLATTRNLKFK